MQNESRMPKAEGLGWGVLERGVDRSSTAVGFALTCDRCDIYRPPNPVV